MILISGEKSSCCGHSGPGYASPMDAFLHGPREKLLYVTCVRRNTVPDKPDYLATVDVDPQSPTYSQVLQVYTMYAIASTYTHN